MTVPALDINTIDELAHGRFGVFNVACPLCGPARQKPVNRRRKVMRIWRLEAGFATFHCCRCGERGFVRDDNSTPQIDRRDFERRLAAARAEAAERERASAAERLAKALALWRGRKPIAGSIAETYLRQARGYRGPLPSTLGFLPARGQHGAAMVAAFGVAYEPEPGQLELPDSQVRGIHITRLAPDGGGKAGTERDKIMLGSSSGYPIVLAPPNDLLGMAITEGIEDALTVHAATGLGAWAAGSASRLPTLADAVPVYIEAVTIAVDDDLAGQRHADELGERLIARGIKEVRQALAREYRSHALQSDDSFRRVG